MKWLEWPVCRRRRCCRRRASEHSPSLCTARKTAEKAFVCRPERFISVRLHTGWPEAAGACALALRRIRQFIHQSLHPSIRPSIHPSICAMRVHELQPSEWACFNSPTSPCCRCSKRHRWHTAGCASILRARLCCPHRTEIPHETLATCRRITESASNFTPTSYFRAYIHTYIHFGVATTAAMAPETRIRKRNCLAHVVTRSLLTCSVLYIRLDDRSR